LLDRIKQVLQLLFAHASGGIQFTHYYFITLNTTWHLYKHRECNFFIRH